MSPAVFGVEEAPEGGYTATAVGASIVTEAGDQTNYKKSVGQLLARRHMNGE